MESSRANQLGEFPVVDLAGAEFRDLHLRSFPRCLVHVAKRRQAGAGTWQLFSHDPNGARVELDFDPAESL